MKRQSHDDVTRRLHELAKRSETGFRYTRHALDEMRADQVSKLDVHYVLKRCPVVRVEQNRMEETWNVRGRDADGRMIEIVLVAYERELKIKIITVWRAREGRNR